MGVGAENREIEREREREGEEWEVGRKKSTGSKNMLIIGGSIIRGKESGFRVAAREEY